MGAGTKAGKKNSGDGSEHPSPPAIRKATSSKPSGKARVVSQSMFRFAPLPAFFERNGEIFHRRGKRGDFHVHARQIISPGRGSPCPISPVFLLMTSAHLSLFGTRENRVAPRRHGRTAYGQIHRGHQRCSFVCAGTPHLPQRNQLAIDLAALRARGPGIINRHSLSAAQIPLSLRRRTRPLGFIPAEPLHSETHIQAPADNTPPITYIFFHVNSSPAYSTT